MLTENIRPHFTLNTIGAIRTLIPEDPQSASDLMLDFSKYIRDRIDQKDYYTPVPFLEELDNIQTYLSLEKARFGDTIEVFYDCTDTQFRILPLTVQPFVENAIKHGLFTVKDGGKLWISTYSTPKGDHVVEITDNGVGFEANQIEEAMNNKKAVGMRSAVMRLESLMKANVSIYSNSETGTNVKIQIPKAGE
jgi:LytS/YehU family sensor histidine kinase